MKRTLYALLTSVIFITGCSQSTRTGTTENQSSSAKTSVTIPDFNTDSAYTFVKKQLEFGPRVPGTKEHEKCARWLAETMKRYTSEMVVQSGNVNVFNGKSIPFRNIIASWKPGTTNRILLCAHWDSRPFADHDPDPANRRKPVDAANDGASGVGILLEIARQLSLRNSPTGIDIMLFDAEDYGPPQDEPTGPDAEEQWGLGSQYWARNPHKPDYSARYGILLDMVGASNATFLMEGLSVHYASDILRLVWDAGNRIGYSSYFLYEQGGYITDDHGPLNTIRKIPTIDIIHLDKNSETGFYPGWHTTHDVLGVIDPATLKAVGQTLLTVIYEEK